jgi:hypothetical protein
MQTGGIFMIDFKFGNDPAKIERYKKFWSREKTDRPLVGFTCRGWFPLQEFEVSSGWEGTVDILESEMVIPEDFMDDQEGLLREGEEIKDDIIRGASPPGFLPWSTATLGCRLQVQPGNIVALERELGWEDVHKAIDRVSESPWYDKYYQFIDVLVKRAGDFYPVSPGIADGPLDFLVKLRGHTQTVFDMIDEPEKEKKALARFRDMIIEHTKEVWEKIPLYRGGFYDSSYNLWSPGPIIRMQEDAMAVTSPALYKEFLAPIDSSLAAGFECAFMHLHTTSCMVLDQILAIKELTAIEMNYEPHTLSLEDTIPHYQQIQKAEKSLIIRGTFSPEEAGCLMQNLEPEGLYIFNMVEKREDVDSLSPIFGLNI